MIKEQHNTYSLEFKLQAVLLSAHPNIQSKETIVFTNEEFSLEVWVDYKHEKGEGRVIYKSEIKEWTNTTLSINFTVPDKERECIVQCIIEFLNKQGIQDITIN